MTEGARGGSTQYGGDPAWIEPVGAATAKEETARRRGECGSAVRQWQEKHACTGDLRLQVTLHPAAVNISKAIYPTVAMMRNAIADHEVSIVPFTGIVSVRYHWV